MATRTGVTLILGILGAAATASSGWAHGPCECLAPAAGPAGTRVVADYPLYKVVFNPDRADLGIGPEELWDRHHGPAPATVLRRPWRHGRKYRGGSFTVPAATPPGRYLVALYDGGESGAHYSWATFTVTSAQSAAPLTVPVEEDDGASTWAVWLAVAAGLALGGAAGIWLARRYSRR